MGTARQMVGEGQPSEWRWVVLGILCFDICVSYIPYYAFVPILPQSMQAYGTNESSLNLLCIIYALVYVPGAFLTGPIVSTCGTRWTFVIAMALTTIGCAVRRGPDALPELLNILPGAKPAVVPTVGDVASPDAMAEPTAFSFNWLLLGQAICAIGQPFLVNLTSEMGAEWFPPNERPLAAMVSNLMNFIGSSLSFMLPPLIVNEEAQSLERVQEEIRYLLWVHFILASVALFLTLTLYRPAPSTNLQSAPRAPMSFVMEVGVIVRSRDFWLVNMQFAVFVAIGHAFDAVEGSLLEHYGYSASLSSWTALSCTIGSIVSTLLEARLIQDATLYRSALELSHAFTAASMVLGFLTLRYHWHEGFFVLAIGIMGLATPGWGCSCELGSEVCFPAREATVGSLLEVCSNLMGVVSIVATQSLIDLGFGARVMVLMAISASVAGLTLQGLTGRLLRSEAEAEEEKEIEMEEHDVPARTPENTQRKRIEDILEERKISISPTTPSAVAPSSYTKRISMQMAKIPQHRWMILAMLPVIGILTAVRLFHNPRKQEEITTLDPLLEGLGHPEIRRYDGDAMMYSLGNYSKPRLANGMLEPVNYVITCPTRSTASAEKKKLDRFKKFAYEANISVRVITCTEGTKREVDAAVRVGLLPESAKQAIGGRTRKGLSRASNIGQAITHLKIMKRVFESKRPANIFDTKEVLYKDFRVLRNQLLGRLPLKVDLVKLNVIRVAGDIVKFEKRSWMRNKIFRMSPGLSPLTNIGLGNYVVAKKGARKVLDIGRSYDTFGKWQSFGEYLLAELVAAPTFVGFAVKADYLSLHCPKKTHRSKSACKA